MTVQTLLGHQKIDTTLAYARLYDSTVAADYYRAMGAVEARLALVDALSGGTLNGKQKETLQALREGIMAQARQWELIDKIELGC